MRVEICRNEGRAKRRLLKYFSLLLASLSLTQCFIKAEAANNYIPELMTSVKNGHPYIDIGVDMADEDVLGTFGFENSSDYTLTYGGSLNKTVGNQEIQSEIKYSGDKAIHLKDTRTNSQGNLYEVPQGASDAINSIFYTDGVIYPKNGEWLSISYKHRTTADKSTYLHTKFQCNKQVNHGASWSTLKYAERIDWRNPPQTIKVYNDEDVPDGQFQVIATNKPSGKTTYIAYYKYSKINHTISYFNTMHPAVPKPSSIYCGIFNPGDDVLIETWPGGSSYKNVKGTDSWITISNNFQMEQDTDLYDFQKDGANLYAIWGTDGDAYIDDIKYGKASKVRLQRLNDNKVVYENYGSEFMDTTANSKPSTVTVTSADTLADTVNFQFSAPNSNTTYKYRAMSLGSSGNNPSPWSKEYSVVIPSNIQGYAVVVDKYPNTDPGTTENNSSGSLAIAGYNRGDIIYAHVRAVDQNGNWSEPVHYKYVVKQTLKDYKQDIKDMQVKNNYDYGEEENLKQNLEESALKLRTNQNLKNYTPRVEIENTSRETEFKEGNKQVKIYLDKNN